MSPMMVFIDGQIPAPANVVHILIVTDAGNSGTGRVYEIDLDTFSVTPVFSSGSFGIMDETQWSAPVSDDLAAQVARGQGSSNDSLLKQLIIGETSIGAPGLFDSYDFTSGGAGPPCITGLEDNKIALAGLIADLGGFIIRTLEWNGSDFINAGSTFNFNLGQVRTGGQMSIASLPTTNIVACFSQDPDNFSEVTVQAVERDVNDDWSDLGARLTISEDMFNGLGGLLPMAALTSTSFVVWSRLTSELIVYTFAGGNWGENPPRLNVPNFGTSCRITNLADNLIALVDANGTLKIFERSLGSFVQRGSDFALPNQPVRSITRFNRTF